MESPITPPRAPAPRGLKRSRVRSSSPTTPSPMRGETQPPSAPSRRRILNFTDFGATRNLLFALEEEARLQQEANEFHAEQDGEEQNVPESEIELPNHPINYDDLCAEWHEEESDESLTEEDGEEQNVPA